MLDKKVMMNYIIAILGIILIGFTVYVTKDMNALWGLIAIFLICGEM